MGAPESGSPNGITKSAYSIQNKNGLGVNDEDEYEYEYHPFETEEFYFTLDLTTNDAKATAAAQTLLEEGADDDGVNEGAPGPSNRSALGHSDRDSGSLGQLEVSDLHSSNPFVRLDNAYYSCNWTTDLGSQVYITEPGLAHNPRRAGKILDVVGLSRARLVGRPAAPRPRQQVAAPTALGSSAINAITIPGSSTMASTSRTPLTESDRFTEQQTARFAAAKANAKNEEERSQAAFLERFSAVKQKKGETDRVPYYGIKKYAAPDDKDEIRKRALEAEPAFEDPRPKRPYKRKIPEGYVVPKGIVMNGSGGVNQMATVHLTCDTPGGSTVPGASPAAPVSTDAVNTRPAANGPRPPSSQTAETVQENPAPPNEEDESDAEPP
ncbi:uncharacterized protein LTR77_006348 [Saxophila tyrrhenica]|uniref:Transcription factor TFIIIC triple barrel domain-containing protein n=1 Tax=Saxophila tyrrhenica TaxID=1690608 RepID=A0AAV9PAM9_9PEZI|nr:hypothetical protein LTR77_006348 [Saxophila tyrrhenica]